MMEASGLSAARFVARLTRCAPTAGLPVGQGSPWGRHVPELPPQLLRRDGKFFLPVNCRVWRLLPAWLHTSISRSCAGLRPGPAVHAARAQGAGRG